VRWILLATLGIAISINITLWLRIRTERIERHLWKGFIADMPDDLTGVEQCDPSRYTVAGRRIYPWFLASSLVTIVLFLAVFLSSLD